MESKPKPSCSAANVFWGEIAPCEHLLQIYTHDSEFLENLADFVASGLAAGDAVVVIVTDAHRSALTGRLRARGIEVAKAIAEGQFLPLDADETLGQFMRNGWPDENLFDATISRVLMRARARSRKVRAFGEMVALLWERGNAGATVRLEHLWNKIMKREEFPLFCAYPKSGFTEGARESLQSICAAHSRLIAV